MKGVGSPPTGTVTFLFTDIEGSTKKWDADPHSMISALKRHNELLQKTFVAHDGFPFKMTGDGFCVAFSSAESAVLAAVRAQQQVSQESWPFPGGLRVRMGIHTGVAHSVDGDYFGPPLNRASRIMDEADGNQVFVSTTTHQLLADAKLGDVRLDYAGRLPLAGLHRPEDIYQLVAPGIVHRSQPLKEPNEPITPQHNIPADERKFFGRVNELAQLKSNFGRRNQRLLTLTGLGGIGKTRLAKELARSVVNSYVDGTVIVECESLTTQDALCAAILSAIGMFATSDSLIDSVVDALRLKDFLLLADGYEALLPNTDLLSQILTNCPYAFIIVTSRRVLKLPWEYEFHVGQLDLKPSRTSLSDAGKLFDDCVRHFKPTWNAGAKVRKQTERIVTKLEGVPLAIVLAAGRARHLSLDELYEQLDSNQLGTLRDPTMRANKHASLGGVIQASYEALSQEVQSLAVNLSIFENGFFLNDAVNVLGADASLIDGIGQLREHSLLIRSEAADRSRYRFYDSVLEFLRQLADEQLRAEFAAISKPDKFEAPHTMHFLISRTKTPRIDIKAIVASLGDSKDELINLSCRNLLNWENVRKAYCSYFADRAEQIRAQQDRGHWQQGSALFWRESANLRKAIELSNTYCDDATLLRLCKTLSRFYLESGSDKDFHHTVSLGLEAAERLRDAHAIATFEGLLGADAMRMGYSRIAREHWQERLAVLMRIGDQDLAAECVLDLANLALRENVNNELLGYLAEFDKLVTTDSALVASADILRAHAAIQSGNQGSAMDYAAIARQESEALRGHEGAFFVWGRLAELYKSAGKEDLAIECLSILIQDALEGGYSHYVGRALIELADCYLAVGRVELSASAIAASLAVPKTSKEVRESAQERRKDLDAKYGPQLYENAERECRGLPWLALTAKVISES